MQETILYFFKSIATPFWDNFFTYVTMLGEQYFIILVIAWIYWNYSKKDGLFLSFIFIFSSLVNSLLKDIVRTRRPFQELSEIEGKRVHTAGGYSFPSGHTQGATTLFITLGLIFRNTTFWILAVLLSLMVALSRVYLGVHWPVDVIGGFLFGLLISIILYHVMEKLYANQGVFFKFLLFSLAFFYLVLIVLVFLNTFSSAQLVKLGYYTRLAGIATGTIPGFIFMEKKFPFSIEAGIGKKILRYLTGISAGVGIFAVMKLYLPDSPLIMFIRYFFLGAWITCIFPFLGLKLKFFAKA